MKNKKQLSMILSVAIMFAGVCLKAQAVGPNTVLYLTGEGAAITDSSGKNYQITVNGNTAINTAQKKFGSSSIYFDGSGDYLTLSNSPDWCFDGGDFTIDFWVFPLNTNGRYVAEFGHDPAGTWSGDNSVSWRAGMNYPFISLSLRDTNGTNTSLQGTTTAFSNEWRHIAVVRTGNVIKIFENGIEKSSNSYTSSIRCNTSKPLKIGMHTSNDSSYYFQGYLDEFRITKGKALWTTGPFEPPAPPPEVGFTVDKNPVNFGESAVLTWSTVDASGCTLQYNDIVASLGLSGTTTLVPSAPTTYTLTATGPGGTTTKELTVKVVNGYTVAGTFTVDGKMGVGVLNPQKELEVNGTIKTKEVQVDITGWADYVFDNAYSLRSIENLEAYIREHKHLPEMPSAPELAQQGLSVTEILQKQMQKIEELTLYLIQLQKENENLEKRVKQLEVQ